MYRSIRYVQRPLDDDLVHSNTTSTELIIPPLWTKQIDDIPDDVLQDIFLILVQGDFNQFGYPSECHQLFYPSSYPWTLSKVSKGWRKICLDAPRLWTYITLDRHQCSHRYFQDEAYKHMRWQLERSRNLPLSIDARMMCYCWEQDQVLRVLLQESNRWELVLFNLVMSAPVQSHVLTGMLETGSLQSLREVKWVGDGENDNGWFLPFKDFTQLVNLQSVTFVRLKYPQAGGHRFPWGQLKKLVLYEYYGREHDLLMMLLHCTDLVHLELHSSLIVKEVDVDESGCIPNGRIAFQHLSTLALLDGYLNTEYSSLLPFIQPPDHILRLQYGTLSPQSIENFLSFVTPSAQSLTSLTMYHPVKFDAGYIRVFETLTNLEHFSLLLAPCLLRTSSEEEEEGDEEAWENEEEEDAEADFDSQCCDWLLKMAMAKHSAEDAQSPGKFKILPHLRRLELHDIDFNPTLLAQMVMSRIEADAARSCNDDGASGIIPKSKSPPSDTTPLRSMRIDWVHARPGMDSDANTEDRGNRMEYYTLALNPILGKYLWRSKFNGLEFEF